MLYARDFIKEFKVCISEYDEEAEFLAAWDAMISKYELRDNVGCRSYLQRNISGVGPLKMGSSVLHSWDERHVVERAPEF